MVNDGHICYIRALNRSTAPEVPNVHLDKQLEADLEEFRKDVLKVQEPWASRNWTYSAMVRLLLRQSLRSGWWLDRAPSAVFSVPFVNEHGSSTLMMEPDETAVIELCSLPSPLPSYELRGLLYEEVTGDAVPQTDLLCLVRRRDHPGSCLLPDLGPDAGRWLSLSSFGKLLPVPIEVRHPDRLVIHVRAIPGDAVRGRATALHGAVSFRLYAVAIPIQPSGEDS